MCQKFSGLISVVTPELWQSKPFGARKDLCTPFSLYHLSGHTQLLQTPQIIQNVRPCLCLISEVTPSLFVNPIVSWVTGDNQKLVYFLVNSSRLYVLSCKFISRITLTFRFNLTSHAKYIVLCGVSHLVIEILSEVSHAFGDKGWFQLPKFEQGSNKWKSVTWRLESTTSVIREMKHQTHVIPQIKYNKVWYFRHLPSNQNTTIYSACVLGEKLCYQRHDQHVLSELKWA